MTICKDITNRLDDFADTCDKTDFDEFGLMASDAKAEILSLRQLVKDHEEAAASVRKNIRLIDIGLHGKDGAAKQASACDLVGAAESLRQKLKDRDAEIERLDLELDLMWGDMREDRS